VTDPTPYPERRNTADKIDALAFQLARIENKTKPKVSLPVWILIGGAAIAACVGLTTLGVTMPWAAASKTELQAVDKAKTVELEAVRTDIATIKSDVTTQGDLLDALYQVQIEGVAPKAARAKVAKKRADRSAATP